MAALSEGEMRKILGADYRLVQEAANRASGIGERERLLRQEIESLEGMKFLGAYSSLIGVALIVASIFSVTGRTLTIQCAIGAAIMLASLASFIVVSGSLKLKRARLATSGH